MCFGGKNGRRSLGMTRCGEVYGVINGGYGYLMVGLRHGFLFFFLIVVWNMISLCNLMGLVWVWREARFINSFLFPLYSALLCLASKRQPSPVQSNQEAFLDRRAGTNIMN